MNRVVLPKQVYRHYKGGFYIVESVAIHTETREPLVIYKSLCEGDDTVWCRPLPMFVERVPGNPHVERFMLIPDDVVATLCASGIV